jgi:hypothetical protein
MAKYEVMNCRGFWLPDNPLIQDRLHFQNVLIAMGDWDGVEDAEDERIFFYMDGVELHVGDIISEGFVVIEIDGESEQ